jgi:hypothetical protein
MALSFFVSLFDLRSGDLAILFFLLNGLGHSCGCATATSPLAPLVRPPAIRPARAPRSRPGRPLPALQPDVGTAPPGVACSRSPLAARTRLSAGGNACAARQLYYWTLMLTLPPYPVKSPVTAAPCTYPTRSVQRLHRRQQRH